MRFCPFLSACRRHRIDSVQCSASIQLIKTIRLVRSATTGQPFELKLTVRCPFPLVRALLMVLHWVGPSRALLTCPWPNVCHLSFQQLYCVIITVTRTNLDSSKSAVNVIAILVASL